MQSRVFIRVAGPTIMLSLMLLAIGVMAALNVQAQQWNNSELISREVHGVLATEDVFLVMREIRRELDLFLRTHAPEHLANVSGFLSDAEAPIALARQLARTQPERDLIDGIARGVEGFKQKFEMLVEQGDVANADAKYAALNDEFLTREVLAPIHEAIKYNRQVVDRTSAAALVTARHMRMGFLLLGVSGSVAGLMSGIAIARTLSRSIVQLDVSVRGAFGKLREVGAPVRISRVSDLEALESGFKNLEEEISGVVSRLQDRERDLMRSEQLAMVGQLAAGMAHELRNPLTPIKILVQNAIERGVAEALGPTQLQIIADEVTRLEKAIQSLLDFARPPEPHHERTEIIDLLYETRELVSGRAIGQDVEIQVVAPKERVVADVDRTQIHQLLLNLVLNSLDAMPQGGVILLQLVAGERYSIPAWATVTEHDSLRIGYEDQRRMFTIYVRDMGPGLSADVLPRAFEPFVTTKETGTGLGLPICQRIAEMHGGTIRVSNRPDRGAEFAIDLPYVQETPGDS